MRLYTARTPSTHRVHFFLAEKQIEIERVQVDFTAGGTQTPEFLAKNSLGELPVLELKDGRILTESVAICRFLETEFPQRPLFGETAFEKAHIEMWTRRVELYLLGPAADIVRNRSRFFASRVEQVAEFAQVQERLLAKRWAWLDQELSDGRTFLTGDQFTFADIMGMMTLIVSGLAEQMPSADLGYAAGWAKRLKERPSWDW